MAGAGSNTRDNPQRIIDYEPAASDVGGLFDDRRRAVKAHGGAAVIGTPAASAAAAPTSQPLSQPILQPVPAPIRAKQRA